MNRVHFTSTTSERATPQAFFDALDVEFGFTLDPCATPTNAKCSTFFTKDDDGLAQSWAGHVVFLNPPYGRLIGHWVREAHESAIAGATVVCLLPARTGTRWWHEYVMAGEVRFVRGHLKFGNATPFPSAVVVFRPSATSARSPREGFDDELNQSGMRSVGNQSHDSDFGSYAYSSTNTPPVHRVDTPNRKGDL
jgi:site-specific DNA-methyltransferase (adenine-specific)